MKVSFSSVAAVLIVSFGLSAQNAPAMEGNKFCQVAESDGVSWFKKPDGSRFFSLGVNCVEPGPSRERYDSTRPAYAAFRHYETTERWADDTLVRLQAWNFNTLGGWCHRAVTKGPLPYTKVLHLGAVCGVPWNDIFAEDFPKQIGLLADEKISPFKDDPLLLGWFTDNEIGWYPDTIFLYHLRQSPKSATRQRLIALLRETYHEDFAALSKDFRSPRAQSFAELSEGGELHPTADGNGQQVVAQFVTLIAERYYKTVHDAIRKVDSSHLILGDRYVSYCPDAVVKAAGPYVDVVSTNYDWPASRDGYLPLTYLRRLHELSGRPVLITEFYVAAKENRSGNRNSGDIFTIVDTQEDRARAFGERLQQLAAEPYVIGAHWFCFSDEPPSGRPQDGEDYNFGLVDINNQPYEPLTTTMTDLHGQVDVLHSASRKTVDAGIANSNRPLSIPAARTLPLDGISTWEKGGQVPTQPAATMSADLLACWDTDHVYVAISGLRYVDATLYREAGAEVAVVPQLQLTVDAPAGGKAMQFNFGDGERVDIEGAPAECRAMMDGVRYTAIAAIPAAAFGKKQLTSGDCLELRAAIRDRHDDGRMRWAATLQLD